MKLVSHDNGDSEFLFDAEVLKKLDFSRYNSNFNTPISAQEPGACLLVRPLCSTDYDKGYLQLLSQLTIVGNVEREQFLNRFSTMKACANTYYIVVVEDTSTEGIVGSASLVIEQKFSHNAGLRGFLEDVVVNDSYRGKQLGKLVVLTVCLLAEHLGCYKITLNCKDKLIKFYQSLGFSFEQDQSNNCMTIRFNQAL